jgi:hypothetical protein
MQQNLNDPDFFDDAASPVAERALAKDRKLQIGISSSWVTRIGKHV